MKKEDALRLKRVIESDRMSITTESTEIIIKDLEGVLSDYFCLDSKPGLKIAQKNGKYAVEISFSALALKSFLSL